MEQFTGSKANHGFKQISASLLDQLTQRMEIRRQFGADREQSFAILSLGFAEKLLPPEAEAAERRLEGFQNLHSHSLPVSHVPNRRIKPCRIFKGAQVICFLCFRRAGNDPGNVDTGHRHGQKTYRRQHREPAAHIFRNGKALPAIFLRHLPQSTVLRIGNGIDAVGRFFGAIAPLQHPFESPEGNGRFQGGTGFGDDDDGKILTLQQTRQFIPMAGTEGIARKENLRKFFGFYVI